MLLHVYDMIIAIYLWNNYNNRKNINICIDYQNYINYCIFQVTNHIDIIIIVFIADYVYVADIYVSY